MDMKEQIEKDVKENPVLIYIKGTAEQPQCGFSKTVIDIFSSLEGPFETRNVLEDPSLREAIKNYSNWPTLPQVYIKGQFIGGCDIVTEMYHRGELQKLVGKA